MYDEDELGILEAGNDERTAEKHDEQRLPTKYPRKQLCFHGCLSTAERPGCRVYDGTQLTVEDPDDLLCLLSIVPSRPPINVIRYLGPNVDVLSLKHALADCMPVWGSTSFAHFLKGWQKRAIYHPPHHPALHYYTVCIEVIDNHPYRHAPRDRPDAHV